MEYKEVERILSENLEVRQLIVDDLQYLAIDLLNKQFNILYNKIDLKEYTLSEIELLDGT